MCVFAYFHSRNPDALNLLIKLFIERSHSLWKVPEVRTAARVAKKRYHGVSIRAYLIISFYICTVNVAICDMSIAHTDTSMNRGTQYAHTCVCMHTTTHTHIMYSSKSC